MGETHLDAENVSTRISSAEAYDTAIRRLFTEESAPNVRQERDLTALTDSAIEFGAVLARVVPEGREKSLAWTHLEDSLIRARRAVFGAPQ